MSVGIIIFTDYRNEEEEITKFDNFTDFDAYLRVLAEERLKFFKEDDPDLFEVASDEYLKIKNINELIDFVMDHQRSHYSLKIIIGENMIINK